MRANAVFIHQRYPRAALQVGHNQFVAIETKRRSDIGLRDEISGDLMLSSVKWCFNITRDSLVHVAVLGRFATLPAAIAATIGKDSAGLSVIAGGRKLA